MNDFHVLKNGTGYFGDPQGARAQAIEFLRQLGVSTDLITPEVPDELLISIANRLETTIADGSAAARVGHAAKGAAAAGDAARTADHQRRRAAGLAFSDPAVSRAKMLSAIGAICQQLDDGRLTDVWTHVQKLRAGQSPAPSNVQGYADPGRTSDVSPARVRELLAHTATGRKILAEARLKGGA
jgi:hypothetical protein